MPPDASVLQVVIFREGTLVGTEVFMPGEYAVGSDPGCELVLADDVLASCQAYLTFREGKISLQDASGGAPLVTINGEAQQQAEVRTRDDVAIGPFLLKFRIVGQKRPGPASRPAPAAPAPVKPAAPARPDSAQASTVMVSMDEPEVTIRASVPESALAPPAPPPRRIEPPRPAAHPPTPRPQPAPKALAPPAPPPPKPVQSTQHYGAGQLPPPSAALVASLTAGQPKAAPEPAHHPVTARGPQPAPTPAGRDGGSVLDAPKKGRKWFRLEPNPKARDLGYRKDDMAEAAVFNEGKEPPGPNLRVRVFWGKSAVGVHGFEFGREVMAGPDETMDVPLYRIDLPRPDFKLAKCEKSGWMVRVPKAMRAFRFESSGWKPADGSSDGDANKVPLEPGKLLRIGDAAYSIELRVDRVKRTPRGGLKSFVHSGALLPTAMVILLSAGLTAGVIFMPEIEEPDTFTPEKALRAATAILKPPDKKKEEKKKEEPKKEEKKEVKKKEKVELPPDVPKTKETKQVAAAIKSVQKVTSGLAVESLLKATTKLAGGPKGYGDKGMGYKLSPLIGKPPVAMAGMGFGPGMGGFGTETKGIGAIRGMGGGGGGGIGAFAAGGTGKGKVGGTVVSAPSSGFKQRAGGGTLARELIAKVINDHLGEVRGCYERALLREAGLAGKLNLEWTIDLSGRVEEVKVKQSTIKGADVPNCVVGALKTWVFPKPTGGKVVVTYPFLFNSVGF